MSNPTAPPPQTDPLQPPTRTFTPPTGSELVECNGQMYYIGEHIGEGAFGAVFACRDEWGNNLVAKVLKPRSQSYDEVREQWLDELNKLETLRHPNITFVHNAFEWRDTFYLIIERCSMTLADLISLPDLKGDLWFEAVATEVLQALHYIHSRGYVHKDLHPGNIFLAWVSEKMVKDKKPILQLKVGDLGISRLESDINIFNTILAEWMIPPEAVDPLQFGPIGRQVDIYHAALCLLALLKGRLPAYDRAAVVAGVPRQEAEALATPLGAVIARALRRHVDDRTPTAIQFWRDIRSAT